MPLVNAADHGEDAEYDNRQQAEENLLSGLRQPCAGRGLQRRSRTECNSALAFGRHDEYRWGLRQPASPQRLLATVEMSESTLTPARVSAATETMAIREMISAYSTSAWPSSRFSLDRTSSVMSVSSLRADQCLRLRRLAGHPRKAG